MSYPGGKGNCYHQIVNRIPPHRVYIEPFLGAGAVMRNKRPARLNIGVDVAAGVLRDTAVALAPAARVISGEYPGQIVRCGVPAGPSELAVRARTVIESDVGGVRRVFICMDALDFLAHYPFDGSEFVYLDPPYLRHTRSGDRQLYAFEFWEIEQHARLLELVQDLDCDVAISGYESDLYHEMLAGWRSHTFEAVTRSGATATEWLWMNYDRPTELHDYSYLGDDYRQRERIKRRKRRWVRGLQRMPVLERKAILQAIEDAGLRASRRK